MALLKFCLRFSASYPILIILAAVVLPSNWATMLIVLVILDRISALQVELQNLRLVLMKVEGRSASISTRVQCYSRLESEVHELASAVRRMEALLADDGSGK